MRAGVGLILAFILAFHSNARWPIFCDIHGAAIGMIWRFKTPYHSFQVGKRECNARIVNDTRTTTPDAGSG